MVGGYRHFLELYIDIVLNWANWKSRSTLTSRCLVKLLASSVGPVLQKLLKPMFLLCKHHPDLNRISEG